MCIKVIQIIKQTSNFSKSNFIHITIINFLWFLETCKIGRKIHQLAPKTNAVWRWIPLMIEKKSFDLDKRESNCGTKVNKGPDLRMVLWVPRRMCVGGMRATYTTSHSESQGVSSEPCRELQHGDITKALHISALVTPHHTEFSFRFVPTSLSNLFCADFCNFSLQIFGPFHPSDKLPTVHTIKHDSRSFIL